MVYRIALLVCDTPAPQVVAVAGGDYAVLFERLLRSAIVEKEKEVSFYSFDSVSGELPGPTDHFEAVLITGSKHGANDGGWVDSLVSYVQHLDLTRTKVIGVCFGHQIVAKAFGGRLAVVLPASHSPWFVVGRVERNTNKLAYKETKNPNGWEAGWTSMDVTDEGKAFFASDAKDTVSFYSMHRDAVTECPPGFSVLISTAVCPIQSLVKENQILTIQSHPEFTADMVREIVKLRRDNGVFENDYASELNETLAKNLPVDSTWFAKQIIKFLGLAQ
ncbi:UNVERIFIED_CONTAM: hypothetical protein HDU68_006437 [Siphonaria sp. JEL0065]|nr:hypothetical protein HDU68_006437 [Siphonaria sp. JEL0065]